VGDAFRGGFLAGYSHGWDWMLCGEVGALAAVYCLECRGPQSHTFTRREFIQRFRQHFDDQGRLDDLLGKPTRRPARRAARPIQKGKKRK
jgi:adenosine kinase